MTSGREQAGEGVKLRRARGVKGQERRGMEQDWWRRKGDMGLDWARAR